MAKATQRNGLVGTLPSRGQSGEPSLDGVWAKLDRADEHLEVLASEIKSFINRDPQPFGFSVPYFDPDTGWHTVYGMVEEEPPERLGVILGDVLHNIRSALDHLIWQLVVLSGAEPRAGSRGNAFPISLTQAQWDTAQGQHLAGVADSHRTIIEKTQPYKRGANADTTYFGWLRFLSDTDKHQVVHPVLAFMLDDPIETVSFQVTNGPGRVVKQQFQSLPFEHGAGLLRCKVEPMTSDTEVEMVGGVPLRIGFSERRAPDAIPNQLLAAARVVVQEFQPAFDTSMLPPLDGDKD